MSRFPRQLPFIVTTEACERFSYYGMLSILTLYLKNELRMEADDAKETVHLFKMAAYFLPLAGAWLADRWLGRYRTILSLALFYCLGHGTLALFEGTRSGIYTGLVLIALGAGGIKPCVSAFVGDQFTAEQAGLLPQVYGLFYWAINFGAMFAFALVPLIRDHLGFRWAFGVPGLFMALATLVFRAGSRYYVKRVPVREVSRGLPETSTITPDSNRDQPGQIARPANTRILGRIAVVLLPVVVFFALYDQVNSSWVLQGSRMSPFALLGYTVDAERIQSVSALLVLFWVPVLTFGIYPLAERLGFRLTPLRRMGAGLVFTALSFGICAWLQRRLEQGETLTLAWQIAPSSSAMIMLRWRRLNSLLWSGASRGFVNDTAALKAAGEPPHGFAAGSYRAGASTLVLRLTRPARRSSPIIRSIRRKPNHRLNGLWPRSPSLVQRTRTPVPAGSRVMLPRDRYFPSLKSSS